MVASTEGWEEPLVVIEGCRIISLETMGSADGEDISGTLQKSLRKLGARPIWDFDIDHLETAKSQAYFKKFGDPIPNEDANVVYELELASFILCKRVLKRFTDEDAAKFTPHHRIFYNYIKHQYELALQGKLDCQSTDFDWLNTTEAFDNEILARVSDRTINGKLMVKLGAAYEQIFLGNIEPLQIMREDELLTEYYRAAIGTDKWAPVLARYVQSLAHKRTELKIFEVGAGTGGTTKVILNALGNRDETSSRLHTYTFTDISSGFFEAASEDFNTWESFLEYKIINIEQDVAKQGAQLGVYDMVVANNVLHATSSIEACLQNCKSLLKP
jgi:phospholipid N-methyltransferase